MKAVILLSGGLDSTLALRVILEQGIEVDALNFTSVFCTCTPKGRGCSVARSAVEGLDVELRVENTSREFLEIVKRPKHCYGSQMNPCIDCRILMFRKARRFMDEIGASFVVTGEVLGERPMSQRRDAMKLIETEACLEGLVVRPLCAALLEPSLPEREGWIDRNKLLAISGRSRRPQIELARHLGISDYPCPAGGCLLTDPEFAARVRDLIRYGPDCVLKDIMLLKVGRHFRLSPGVKVVVGRDDNENDRIRTLAEGSDVVLELKGIPGPLTLVRGKADRSDLAAAARLTAVHSQARHLESATVSAATGAGLPLDDINVATAGADALVLLRVGS